IRASSAASATPLAVPTPGRADSCARTDVSATAPFLPARTTRTSTGKKTLEHQFDTFESTPSGRERQGNHPSVVHTSQRDFHDVTSTPPSRVRRRHSSGCDTPDGDASLAQ